MRQLREVILGFLLGLLVLVMWAQSAGATTITWSRTFADGEVLSASDLETMKTNITDVVNTGGGPVSLTGTQTISGDKTLSGTTTFSGTIAFSGSGGFGSSLVFEGATADDYELTLAVPDATADVTYTIQGSTSVASYIKSFQNAGTSDVSIVFEGATADNFEATLTFTDPTADVTFTFPAAEDITFGQQVIKGWVNWSHATTINDSFNVTSITDNGSGEYVVTWATDFANANFAVAGYAHDTTSTTVCIVGGGSTTAAQAAGTTEVQIMYVTGATVCVPEYASLIAIGDR